MAPAPKLDWQDLLQRAETAMEAYPPQVSLAKKFYVKALSLGDEDNVNVLDVAGEFFAEFDDPNMAVTCFRRSAELVPLANPRKFFYLGQLTQGREALQWFTHGLSVIDFASEDERNRAVSALCSMGELWMTDLCDESEAQTECERCFVRALEVAPGNFEALVGMATYRKVLGELEEAKRLCLEAVAQIGNPEIPFPLRLNLGKTLIDLELSDEALEVLHGLLEEDEEDCEVWFLVGTAHFVASDFEAAIETVEHAKSLCNRDHEQRRLWWDALSELGVAVSQAASQQPPVSMQN